METVEGSMPGIDQYNRVAKIALTRRVITKTASYTCKIEESGAVLIANHATVAVVFTLPAVAVSAGVYYNFFNVGAAEMDITAPSGTLVSDGSAATTTIAFAVSAHIIGGAALVICDGTNWYAFCAANLLAVPAFS